MQITLFALIKQKTNYFTKNPQNHFLCGQPPPHTQKEQKSNQASGLYSPATTVAKKGLQYISITQAHLAPCTKLYQSLNEQIFGFANEKKFNKVFCLFDIMSILLQ